MDLSQVPEKDRQRMLRLIEEKQAKQFMSLYSFVVEHCFEDCVNDFTSEALSAKENDCLKRCTNKLLKMTNRIGQQIAEKQMNPTQSPSL